MYGIQTSRGPRSFVFALLVHPRELEEDEVNLDRSSSEARTHLLAAVEEAARGFKVFQGKQVRQHLRRWCVVLGVPTCERGLFCSRCEAEVGHFRPWKLAWSVFGRCLQTAPDCLQYVDVGGGTHA